MALKQNKHLKLYYNLQITKDIMMPLKQVQKIE